MIVFLISCHGNTGFRCVSFHFRHHSTDLTYFAIVTKYVPSDFQYLPAPRDRCTVSAEGNGGILSYLARGMSISVYDRKMFYKGNKFIRQITVECHPHVST